MRCEIFVNNHRGETIPVYVDSEELENMTVEEFRRRLDGADHGEDYRLIFITRPLEDHESLWDCGIKDKSTLLRIDLLCGGGGRCIIYVKDLRGKTIPVDVDSEELKNMTVEEFRRRLDGAGQGEDYRLIFSGRQLHNHQKLWDCGIKHDSTLHMVYHLCGGGDPLSPEVGGLPRTVSKELLAPPMQQEKSNGGCSIQ